MVRRESGPEGRYCRRRRLRRRIIPFDARREARQDHRLGQRQRANRLRAARIGLDLSQATGLDSSIAAATRAPRGRSTNKNRAMRFATN